MTPFLSPSPFKIKPHNIVKYGEEGGGKPQ